MKDGIDMSRWLKKIEKDQNLQELSELETNLISTFRRWFVSRLIGVQVAIGRYSTTREKFVLGDPRYNDKVPVADATNQAAKTYTYAFDVFIFAITASNATRAPQYTVEYSDGTTTVTLPEVNAGAAGATHSILGGGVSAGAAAAYGNIINGFFLPAGHSIVVTDTAFVAADDTQNDILYARA